MNVPIENSGREANMDGVKNLTIRVLTDNNAVSGAIWTEHGLSLWIEADDDVILFDTGAGPALVNNAPRLGLDLKKVSQAVISHGHSDHSGGLAGLVETRGVLPLHLHPDALIDRFSSRRGSMRSIGMPPASRGAVHRSSGQVVWCREPVLVRSGVWVTGPIPRRLAHHVMDPFLFLDEAGIRPDLIVDDQAMWIDMADGIVVVTGCAHSGLENTLGYISELTNKSPVKAIVGGLHLSRASHEQLSVAAQALDAVAPSLIIPCHCTGDSGTAFLKERFGTRCVQGLAGAVYSF
ncbi:MAG TPA: MBL fold metallo-hydrolase [Elusimicrobiota bacterium]|nr:MBL fold metallo-hydrolase [Elusimicrobiota bacterium]